jgi:hypothetical protein
MSQRSRVAIVTGVAEAGIEPSVGSKGDGYDDDEEDHPDQAVFRLRARAVHDVRRGAGARGRQRAGRRVPAAFLEFGICEDEGLRCCHHGWLFGVDGTILETPGDPPEPTLRHNVCHGAYPVIEYEGLIFGYFGLPDLKPAFPIYDSYEREGGSTRRSHSGLSRSTRWRT